MINVMYKCRCMPDERTIECAERPPGSDLMIWFGVMQNTIAMDHTARSPHCRASELEYAKIPMDEGAEEIGGKRRIN